MTVISTLLTSDCIVHATDSFITIVQPNGTLRVVESQAPKVVAVRHFRGALSFCGFAGINRNRMLAWLARRAESANNFPAAEPDRFADWLAIELNSWLINIPGGPLNENRGVGIHFTVHETTPFGQIPELFWITNLDGANRVQARVTAQRQSIITLTNARELPSEDQPDFEQRRRVQVFLRQPFQFMRYNNGDSELYVPQANATIDSAQTLRQRGVLIEDRLNYAGRLALLPVEAVCNMQRHLSRPGTRAVGGRPHNLIITPTGQYSSHTGLRLIPGT